MSTRTLPYQPALDGLRAVAVSMVLAFHAGASWMSGGYVGVSVFFTLSGYLITSLLLAEHERTGGIGLGAFYGRRMKRLLPASLLCLVLVMGFAAAGAFDYVDDLRSDVLGALFQVANWVKLFGDVSYADLTNATLGRVAPLEHYWSLAIEEQFYWIWPLVMVVVLGRATTRRARLLTVGAFTAAAAVAAPVIAVTWGADAAYWATPARAGEILVGALLAVVLHGREALDQRTRWLAPAGLVVIVWAAVTWPSASGPAYRGWLPVFALAAVAVIAGLQSESPLRRLLSSRPFVRLGAISYGVYLFHWPIFALVTAEWLGRGGWMLAAVRLIVTLVTAVASYRLIERPARRWSPARPAPLLVGAVLTVCLAVMAVVVLEPPRPTVVNADPAGTIPPVDGTIAPLGTVVRAPDSQRSGSGASVTVTEAPGATSSTSITMPLPERGAPVPIPEVSRPVRVVVVGDSTAQFTAAGMVAWAADHPTTAQVTDASEPGCGFVRDGIVPTDGAIDWAGRCRVALDERLPQLLADLQPDVAMLMVTMRDVEDRIWSVDEGVLPPTDPRFRERLLDHYRTMATTLFDGGVEHIAWVLPPHPIAMFQGEQRKMLDPARYEVQFDVIRTVAAEHPGRIGVLDLDDWIIANGLQDDLSIRPDGLHFAPEFAYLLSDQYLIGSVADLAVGQAASSSGGTPG